MHGENDAQVDQFVKQFAESGFVMEESTFTLFRYFKKGYVHCNLSINS